MAPVSGQVTPQDLGSLAGTLDPAAAFTLAQAFQNQQAQELAARTQAATEAANQAQGQFTQASQAPPPDIGGAGLIPSLFGNFASVFSGNPAYQQQAHEDIQQQKRALLQARADNLNALHDVYKQKADEAQRAGDLETELKNRTKLQNIHDAIDQVNSNIQRHDTLAKQAEDRRQAALQRINAQNVELIAKGLEPTIGTRKPYTLLPYVDKSAAQFGGADPGDVMDALTTKTDWGDLVEINPIKMGVKDRAALTALAGQNNKVPLDPKEIAVLRDIQKAKDNLHNQFDQISSYLPDLSGMGTADKLKAQAEQYAKNKWGATFGKDPVLAGFNAWWANVVTTMRAQAGTQGLRINRSEIERALQYDRPDFLHDSQQVLAQKMANWDALLDNGAKGYMSHDWTSNAKDSGFARSNKISMMDPDGNISVHTKGDALKLLNHGWARVMTQSPMPRSASPANAGPPVMPPVGAEADSIALKYKHG